MNYKVALNGFEGQNVEVQPPGLFTGPKLLVAGQPAPAGAKRGEMVLRRNDGKDVTVAWKPQLMGLDVPRLAVDGSVVEVVKPLPWYVLAWSALPLVLILIGGLLGGVTGAVAAYLNLKLFRTSLPGVVKFIFSAVVGGVAVLVYFLVALTLLSAVGQ